MNRVLILAGVLCAFLPLFPFVPISYTFQDDWNLNYWSANYFYHYLKSYGSFPDVFNTDQSIGMPHPIFYGHFLYPAISVLALPFDDIRIGIRILFAAVWGLQFLLSYQLAKKLTNCFTLSFIFACLINWTIYPLTNIYVRGALNEAFAVACLTCATLSWFLFITTEVRSAKEWGFAFLTAGFLSFSFGSHPITFAFGAPWFALTALASLFWVAKENLVRKLSLSLTAATGVLLCLLPWIFQLFDSGLNKKPLNIFRFADNIDHVWGRYSPLPVPWGINSPLKWVDANTNTPLSILLIFALFYLLKTRSKPLKKYAPLVVALASFYFFSSLSLSHRHEGLAASIVRQAQFYFRMVSYMNLSLIFAMVAVFKLAPQLPWRRWILGLCFFLGLSACDIKLYHAYQLRTPIPDFAVDEWTQGPHFLETMEHGGWGMYCVNTRELMPENLEKELIPISFKVDRKTQIFSVPPLEVAGKKGALFLVNLCDYPANKLFLDGKPIAHSNTMSYIARPVIRIPDGVHTLEYRFESAKYWPFLKTVSKTTIVALVVLSGIFFIKSLTDRKRKNA